MQLDAWGKMTQALPNPCLTSQLDPKMAAGRAAPWARPVDRSWDNPR
jgi:hypothetical protein